MMSERYTATVLLKCWNGNEYELQVAYDTLDPPKRVPLSLMEADRGRIYPTIPGFKTSPISWDSLSEMTHDLRVEIISWGSDTGN